MYIYIYIYFSPLELVCFSSCHGYTPLISEKQSSHFSLTLYSSLPLLFFIIHALSHWTKSRSSAGPQFTVGELFFRVLFLSLGRDAVSTAKPQFSISIRVPFIPRLSRRFSFRPLAFRVKEGNTRESKFPS